MTRVLLAVAVLGCGKRAAGTPGAGSATASAPVAGSATASSAPVTTAPRGSATPAPAPEPPGVDVLAAATATKTPSLIGPFAKLPLTPELTGAGVLRAAPELCKGQATIAAWCELRTPTAVFRVERIVMDGEPESWPIGRLRISLPGKDVRERLTAAWGAPQGDVHRSLWFAPKSHLRVVLHKAEMPGDPGDWVDLDFSGYTTLDELLGTDKKRFAFERGTPLLGARLRDVAARYAPRFNAMKTSIVLWPVEDGTTTEIQIGNELDEAFDDAPSTVTGYTVNIRGISSSLDEALARRFGKPRETEDGALFRRKPKLVSTTNDSFSVGDVDY